MRFTSYAQNFEDVMLRRALGRIEHGFYIDIGAADPVEYSVTKTFYDAGWHGVNIEPAPHYFGRLHAARPKDINLEVAVGRVAGISRFHQIDDTGLSTMDAEIAAGHALTGYAVQERDVEMTTLAEICRRYVRGDVHFLKIDVEGAEGEVLAGGDFGMCRPWIVLLEATRPLTTEISADWEAGLLAVGYVFVWFDGLNRFYVAQERQDELRPHFQLPPNSFDGFDLYDHQKQTKIDALQAVAKVEQARAEDAACATREHAAEVKLLENQVWLLRRMQTKATVDLEQARRTARALEHRFAEAEYARTALDETQRELVEARKALEVAQASSGHAAMLHRLAFDLKWDEAPRALKMVLPLARSIRSVRNRLSPHTYRSAGLDLPPVPLQAAPDQLLITSTLPDAQSEDPPPRSPRVAVHQFHPGSSYGDAVTNSMLLTQRILRDIGFNSEIYVEYLDERLQDRLLLLDDLPTHDDYVLIVLHSLGYPGAERIAALPAPKVLMYHNITPADFLRDTPGLAALADLGREQLDFWRGQVAAALAVSSFNALELRRHGFETVEVCPLLFDLAALRARTSPGRTRLDTDPFTVLFVGRLVESKGQADLVDAFAAFRTQFSKPCRLVLVGRIEGGGEGYLAEVHERVSRHGLRRHVVVTDQVSDEELTSWFDRADLYVSLSQHEGFGVPLIEAMAHDVPVVAYAAGAIPFTLGDGGTAVLSRAPDVVAAAMLEIAHDPAKRAELLKRQRNNLDRFDLKTSTSVLLAALTRAGAWRPVSAQDRNDIAQHLNFTVTGHFNGSYSLAAVNRTMAIALDEQFPFRTRIVPVEGVAASLTDVPFKKLEALTRLERTDPPPAGTHIVISQHYPVHVPPANGARPDVLAAFFFWEESLVPEATVALLNMSFDTVFVPSRFVAKSLIDSGFSKPVHVVGYAPDLEDFAEIGKTPRQPRRRDQPFTFLHISSAFPRKGVNVLLRAFATLQTLNVRLVLKTFPNPHNDVVRQIEVLRQGEANLPEIVLINRDLSEDELLQLYRDADAAVLPTRGEGFNIPAAEAIAAGLPLLVTAAGGHMDFITVEDAELIPCSVRYSGSHFAIGQSLWFEPDEVALAAAMRAISGDSSSGIDSGKAQARAGQARRNVMRRLNRGDWTRRVAKAATDVLLAPKPRPLRLAWLSSWNVRCGVAEYTRHATAAFSTVLEAGDEQIILADDRAGQGEPGPHRTIRAWACHEPDVNWLAQTISREGPDAVLIQHQPGLISWLSLAALLEDKRLRQRLVLVTLHATAHMFELAEPDLGVVVAALRTAARVIVHNAADVNMLQQVGIQDNVVMIPQGAPQAGASPSLREITAGDPVIGCYGFLLPAKGLRQLISALPHLKRSWPKLRLRMVTALHSAQESATEHAACLALAEALGVAGNIDWFTDFLPHEDSTALLQACDVIVLPYAHTGESSSAALRSCLASGTPVAVSPIPIFDEAGTATFRLPGQSAEQIAAGLTDLLRDLPARQALQRAARDWIEERDWNKIATRTYGMIRGLLANRSLGKDVAMSTSDRAPEAVAAAATPKSLNAA